jgi:hypothetical protein
VLSEATRADLLAAEAAFSFLLQLSIQLLDNKSMMIVVIHGIANQIIMAAQVGGAWRVGRAAVNCGG